MNMKRVAWVIAALIALVGCSIASADAPTTFLSPVAYIPLVRKDAIAPPAPPTPPPSPFTMDLYIENQTCGELCYQILDVGPIECVQLQGKRFYKAIPYGEYEFWAQGCIDQTYVEGLAPFMYRSATLFFSCAIFEGPIWAKMYEMR